MDSSMKVRITGKSPLLMHNARRLANPLDPLTKEIKAITSKRKKTDEDYAQLFWLEWQGGLYWSSHHGVALPGENVEAALIEAARIMRAGAKLERAFRVLEDFCPLVYKGPKDPQDLYESGEFSDVRQVGVNNALCMRCRPIFKEWAFEATLLYGSETVNKGDLEAALNHAGELTGLGDYRPRYGKFTWSLIEG